MQMEHGCGFGLDHAHAHPRLMRHELRQHRADLGHGASQPAATVAAAAAPAPALAALAPTAPAPAPAPTPVSDSDSAAGPESLLRGCWWLAKKCSQSICSCARCAAASGSRRAARHCAETEGSAAAAALRTSGSFERGGAAKSAACSGTCSTP
eukprot:scaffold45248_cov63-Phaeocystis_antarctica.AAC.2